MTREEAIQYNKNLREYMKITDKESEYKFSEENYIALDMANKALEIVNDFERAQIITGGRLNGRTYAYKCGLADGQRLAKGEKIFNILPLEQQPCDDCISRDEAIRIAEQGQIQGYEWEFKKLCTLPSLTPQQKIGHWIDVDSLDGALWHTCSECGETEFYATDYCPNCGAKMEVEE